ncbi:MAG: phosphatidate cytidylyltransferase [Acidobacteriia bacterium]|nr:phosphatidate cytidylyltransferase [Terriglobia bacterium]
MKRIATALVLIPVVVWLVLAAPEWAFKAVVAAVALIAFHEFDQIAGANGIARPGYFGMIAGLAVMLAPMPYVVIVMGAIAGMLLALRVPDLAGAMAAAAVFVLGVVYIFGAWRTAIELRDVNPHWLMFALLLSWVGDTAALYVGKSIGRHRMAPRISPGKTWEGAAGSIAGAVLGGVAYAHYLIPSASLPMVIALAAIGNVAGQGGDLCESAMKRGAGVKDSGTSLPGHGGWLDRIDSSLFSIPVVYGLLKLLS